LKIKSLKAIGKNQAFYRASLIQFSQQTKKIPRTSASISLQRFYFAR
jgi:hypothetical protein